MEIAKAVAKSDIMSAIDEFKTSAEPMVVDLIAVREGLERFVRVMQIYGNKFVDDYSGTDEDLSVFVGHEQAIFSILSKLFSSELHSNLLATAWHGMNQEFSANEIKILLLSIYDALSMPHFRDKNRKRREMVSSFASRVHNAIIKGKIGKAQNLLEALLDDIINGEFIPLINSDLLSSCIKDLRQALSMSKSLTPELVKLSEKLVSICSLQNKNESYCELPEHLKQYTECVNLRSNRDLNFNMPGNILNLIIVRILCMFCVKYCNGDKHLDWCSAFMKALSEVKRKGANDCNIYYDYCNSGIEKKINAKYGHECVPVDSLCGRVSFKIVPKKKIEK